jgi:hypothetical protein
VGRADGLVPSAAIENHNVGVIVNGQPLPIRRPGGVARYALKRNPLRYAVKRRAHDCDGLCVLTIYEERNP